MSLLQECDIGKKLNEACHKSYFAKSTGFVDIGRLADEDVEPISRRTSVPQDELKSICKHHHMTFWSEYHLQWKKCFDPYAKHKKTVKTGLVSISLIQANKWPWVLEKLSYLVKRSAERIGACYKPQMLIMLPRAAHHHPQKVR